MLFKETVPVYCENHTERIHSLHGQNAQAPDVVRGISSNHCITGLNNSNEFSSPQLRKKNDFVNCQNPRMLQQNYILYTMKSLLGRNAM
jgi:hypothetical protein